MKSLTFSFLICASNLYFVQKLLRKAKFARGCQNCKKLLQTPKVAQKLPSTIGTGLIPKGYRLIRFDCAYFSFFYFDRLKTIRTALVWTLWRYDKFWKVLRREDEGQGQITRDRDRERIASRVSLSRFALAPFKNVATKLFAGAATKEHGRHCK